MAVRPSGVRPDAASGLTEQPSGSRQTRAAQSSGSQAVARREAALAAAPDGLTRPDRGSAWALGGAEALRVLRRYRPDLIGNPHVMQDERRLVAGLWRLYELAGVA
jgi:hypothetical protein